MTQMTQLLDKDIRTDIINIPQMLKKVEESMDMTKRKKQKDPNQTLEMKNTMFGMKNTLNGINSRLYITMT